LIEIRQARWPDDVAGVTAIDRAFETDKVLAAAEEGQGLALHLVSRRQTKTFPLDDLESPERPWDRAWVAVEADHIVGFAATGFQAWNTRLVLWHFYVDRSARRQGVGRQLLDAALNEGRRCGARRLWLETSNQNTPGMAAYRALGLRLTGLDLTIYDGTPAEGEFAVFFSCPVEPSA
jgi:ribosomal protein S18 acetylase RimI-like enzyme